MRVALYMRVSTQEQSMHGLSLEAQKDRLEEYANGHNYNIVGTYVDAGITARKKLHHRKELLRLLEDVKQDKIDLIIFTKLDRWFRNIADYYKIQEVLDQHNVNWKSIFESYDTSTSNGRLHINIMLSIAQDEADRTSERIRTVFENQRQRGNTPTPSAPLGYKVVDGKTVVDEETAPLAVEIFNIYDTYHSAAKCLAYSKEVGHPITSSALRVMLKNKRYIGEFHGIKDFCDALVPAELFYRIQYYKNIKSYHTAEADNRTYLFSTLVFCEDCGHAMTSTFTTRKGKNGKVEYRYYRCKTAVFDKKCPHTLNISESIIESFLLDNIEKMAKEKIRDISTSNELVKPKVNIDKLNKKLERLKDLYINDMIDMDMYKRDYETIKQQIDEALVFNQEVPDPEKYEVLINSDFRVIYETLDPGDKKAFWLGVIEKIYINNSNEISFLLQ